MSEFVKNREMDELEINKAKELIKLKVNDQMQTQRKLGFKYKSSNKTTNEKSLLNFFARASYRHFSIPNWGLRTFGWEPKTFMLFIFLEYHVDIPRE